jgi:hypothetical protein
MKKIILFYLLIFASIANAQKLSIADGTKILENGTQIAKYEKTMDNYTVISNMDEDDLVSLDEQTDEDYNVNHVVVTFSDDNQSVAYLPTSKKVNNIEVLCKAKVFKNGALNPEAIQQFCTKNTLDAVLKKPIAKQAKNDIKEQKVVAKEEADEEKEFAKEEKVTQKTEKKSTRQEELEAKKELRAEKLAEKKDDREFEKSTKRESKSTEEKKVVEQPENAITKDEAPAEQSKVIRIAKDNIYSNEKLVAKFATVEGMISGKKGKTINVQNLQGKRIAIIKYQYGGSEAKLQNMKDKTITTATFFSETEENVNFELISKLVEIGVL